MHYLLFLFLITGLNEIHMVKTGDLVFVDHPKYYDKALNSAASAILINKKVKCPTGKALLISDDPYRDFNILARYFKPFLLSSSSLHSSANIGKNTHIHPNVYIGPNVTIGNNCLIHANVSIICDTVIGNDVVIGSSSVIGGDAFYYKNYNDKLEQLHSCGRVLIEDNVYVPSGTTIL